MTMTRGHLKLVHPSPGSRPQSSEHPIITVPADTSIRQFVDAAASFGLSMDTAGRLALERALVLVDIAPLGLDPDAAQYRLGSAALSTRPRRPLPPGQASYLRALRLGRAVRAQDLSGGLTIAAPERLLPRAREILQPATFEVRAIPEMISWETAAVIEGRSMSEWALTVLASARAAS